MNRFLPDALLRHLLLLTLAAMPLTSHAIERPEYEVIRKFGNLELRQCAPYHVTELVLNATAIQAGSQAFRILAGYIVGENKGEKKFEMTAPVVTQTATPAEVDMTAPVTQAAVPGARRVQFVLPKGVTQDFNAEALDPHVQLRLEPASQSTAVCDPGAWSQSNDAEHLALPKGVFDKAGAAKQGEPMLARCHATFTPWFLRHNEIWLGLR